MSLALDGAPTPDRWASERIAGARPREVVRLLGVASLPQPATLDVSGSSVARLRLGLHSGPNGPELHVVADLADPRARLAGVEAGKRSLDLVFLVE